jgi:hypothetical protein
MFRPNLLVLVLVIAASAGPALGQGSPASESHACFNQRVDQAGDLPGRLAACSRVIGNSGASPEERAEAHLRRAFAYAQKAGQANSREDVDRALADLSAASRLTPNNQAVQKYVLETRASLLRLAEAPAPKAAEADKRGADAKEVALLRDELRKTQEAFKATQERLAALEAAKAPAPVSEPEAPDPAKLARDLQSELKRVGCDPGAIDAQWGQSSRRALQKFADRTALALPVAEPTTAALDAVSARQDRVCPVQCDSDETEVNGTCVARRSKARSKRPYVSRRERSPRTSSEQPPPSGGPPIGIIIGVGRGRGIGIGF